MPHLRMSPAAPPYLQDRPADRCHMQSRTQDTCAGLDTCETQHVPVCGYLCKKSPAKKPCKKPCAPHPTCQQYQCMSPRAHVLTTCCSLAKLFTVRMPARTSCAVADAAAAAASWFVTYFLFSPVGRSSGSTAHSVAGPTHSSASAPQRSHCQHAWQRCQFAGNARCHRSAHSCCKKASLQLHSRAKALNCSSMNGSVAHVSVASFHDVRNIITAPRMTVTRDLQ